MFKQIIKGRSREEKKGDHDLLDWVMNNTEYSKEQVFDFILHTLFAGHDTTSRAIALMIYFLEGFPQAIQQLRVSIYVYTYIKINNEEHNITVL